jgi:hypothetical protein
MIVGPSLSGIFDSVTKGGEGKVKHCEWNPTDQSSIVIACKDKVFVLRNPIQHNDLENNC